MPASSDDILDLVRTREVTGVFHSRKALDAAVQDLLLADVDRADSDVSASVDELQRRLNYSAIPAPDLADIPTAPRQPYVAEDDVVGTDAVVGSIAGCAAAVDVAVLWARRRLQRERAQGLEKLSEAQGLLIWVRVRSPEQEAQAQEILVRHGAEAVHVHEIDLAKRPEDLPLQSLRPDPWLGDERLGPP